MQPPTTSSRSRSSTPIDPSRLDDTTTLDSFDVNAQRRKALLYVRDHLYAEADPAETMRILANLKLGGADPAAKKQQKGKSKSIDGKHSRDLDLKNLLEKPSEKRNVFDLDDWESKGVDINLLKIKNPKDFNFYAQKQIEPPKIQPFDKRVLSTQVTLAKSRQIKNQNETFDFSATRTAARQPIPLPKISPVSSKIFVVQQKIGTKKIQTARETFHFADKKSPNVVAMPKPSPLIIRFFDSKFSFAAKQNRYLKEQFSFLGQRQAEEQPEMRARVLPLAVRSFQLDVDLKSSLKKGTKKEEQFSFEGQKKAIQFIKVLPLKVSLFSGLFPIDKNLLKQRLARENFEFEQSKPRVVPKLLPLSSLSFQKTVELRPANPRLSLRKETFDFDKKADLTTIPKALPLSHIYFQAEADLLIKSKSRPSGVQLFEFSKSQGQLPTLESSKVRVAPLMLLHFEALVALTQRTKNKQQNKQIFEFGQTQKPSEASFLELHSKPSPYSKILFEKETNLRADPIRDKKLTEEFEFSPQSRSIQIPKIYPLMVKSFAVEKHSAAQANLKNLGAQNFEFNPQQSPSAQPAFFPARVAPLDVRRLDFEVPLAPRKKSRISDLQLFDFNKLRDSHQSINRGDVRIAPLSLLSFDKIVDLKSKTKLNQTAMEVFEFSRGQINQGPKPLSFAERSLPLSISKFDKVLDLRPRKSKEIKVAELFDFSKSLAQKTFPKVSPLLILKFEKEISLAEKSKTAPSDIHLFDFDRLRNQPQTINAANLQVAPFAVEMLDTFADLAPRRSSRISNTQLFDFTKVQKDRILLNAKDVFVAPLSIQVLDANAVLSAQHRAKQVNTQLFEFQQAQKQKTISFPQKPAPLSISLFVKEIDLKNRKRLSSLNKEIFLFEQQTAVKTLPKPAPLLTFILDVKTDLASKARSRPSNVQMFEFIQAGVEPRTLRGTELRSTPLFVECLDIEKNVVPRQRLKEANRELFEFEKGAVQGIQIEKEAKNVPIQSPIFRTIFIKEVDLKNAKKGRISLTQNFELTKKEEVRQVPLIAPLTVERLDKEEEIQRKSKTRASKTQLFFFDQPFAGKKFDSRQMAIVPLSIMRLESTTKVVAQPKRSSLVENFHFAAPEPSLSKQPQIQKQVAPIKPLSIQVLDVERLVNSAPKRASRVTEQFLFAKQEPAFLQIPKTQSLSIIKLIFDKQIERKDKTKAKLMETFNFEQEKPAVPEIQIPKPVSFHRVLFIHEEVLKGAKTKVAVNQENFEFATPLQPPFLTQPQVKPITVSFFSKTTKMLGKSSPTFYDSFNDGKLWLPRKISSLEIKGYTEVLILKPVKMFPLLVERLEAENTLRTQKINIKTERFSFKFNPLQAHSTSLLQTKPLLLVPSTEFHGLSISLKESMQLLVPAVSPLSIQTFSAAQELSAAKYHLDLVKTAPLSLQTYSTTQELPASQYHLNLVKTSPLHLQTLLSEEELRTKKPAEVVRESYHLVPEEKSTIKMLLINPIAVRMFEHEVSLEKKELLKSRIETFDLKRAVLCSELLVSPAHFSFFDRQLDLKTTIPLGAFRVQPILIQNLALQKDLKKILQKSEISTHPVHFFLFNKTETLSKPFIDLPKVSSLSVRLMTGEQDLNTKQRMQAIEESFNLVSEKQTIKLVSLKPITLTVFEQLEQLEKKELFKSRIEFFDLKKTYKMSELLPPSFSSVRLFMNKQLEPQKQSVSNVRILPIAVKYLLVDKKLSEPSLQKSHFQENFEFLPEKTLISLPRSLPISIKKGDFSDSLAKTETVRTQVEVFDLQSKITREETKSASQQITSIITISKKVLQSSDLKSPSLFSQQFSAHHLIFLRLADFGNISAYSSTVSLRKPVSQIEAIIHRLPLSLTLALRSCETLIRLTNTGSKIIRLQKNVKEKYEIRPIWFFTSPLFKSSFSSAQVFLRDWKICYKKLSGSSLTSTHQKPCKFLSAVSKPKWTSNQKTTMFLRLGEAQTLLRFSLRSRVTFDGLLSDKDKSLPLNKASLLPPRFSDQFSTSIERLLKKSFISRKMMDWGIFAITEKRSLLHLNKQTAVLFKEKFSKYLFSKKMKNCSKHSITNRQLLKPLPLHYSSILRVVGRSLQSSKLNPIQQVFNMRNRKMIKIPKSPTDMMQGFYQGWRTVRATIPTMQQKNISVVEVERETEKILDEKFERNTVTSFKPETPNPVVFQIEQQISKTQHDSQELKEANSLGSEHLIKLEEEISTKIARIEEILEVIERIYRGKCPYRCCILVYTMEKKLRRELVFLRSEVLVLHVRYEAFLFSDRLSSHKLEEARLARMHSKIDKVKKLNVFT